MKFRVRCSFSFPLPLSSRYENIHAEHFQHIPLMNRWTCIFFFFFFNLNSDSKILYSIFLWKARIVKFYIQYFFEKQECISHFHTTKICKSFKKNRIFYRFKKSAWVEIFGSKKSTYLGKGGHMVAIINAVNVSLEIPCWNPW